MQVIPIENPTPHFSENVTLDGVRYTLTFDWSERGQSWSLGVANADTGELIAAGVAIRINVALLNRLVGQNFPPGLLEAIDTSSPNIGEDPGFADLGARVQIVYTPLEEVRADLGLS